MKNQINEYFIIKAILHEADLEWSSILSPEGQYARIVRRSAIWAYDFYLKAPKPEIQKKFKVESLQSVYRILRTKNLQEDEYNFRLSLKHRIEFMMKNSGLRSESHLNSSRS